MAAKALHPAPALSEEQPPTKKRKLFAANDAEVIDLT